MPTYTKPKTKRKPKVARAPRATDPDTVVQAKLYHSDKCKLIQLRNKNNMNAIADVVRSLLKN